MKHIGYVFVGIALIFLADIRSSHVVAIAQSVSPQPKPLSKKDVDRMRKEIDFWMDEHKNGYGLIVDTGKTWYFYKCGTLEPHGTDTFRVWLKLRPMPADLIQWQKDFQDKRLYFIKEYIEFDCTRRMTETLEMHLYDKAGRAFDSTSSRSGRRRIIPDTAGETVFAMLCAIANPLGPLGKSNCAQSQSR